LACWLISYDVVWAISAHYEGDHAVGENRNRASPRTGR